MNGPSLDYHFFSKELFRPVNECFQVKNMEQFCGASMFVQADSIGYIMAHYRRLAPKASGCIIWQYNEPWPTGAWSIIDYYGLPKMALYALRQSCAPVLLSLKDESWTINDGKLSAEWYITSDCGFAGAVGLKAYSADGTVVFAKELQGDWKAGTHLLSNISESLPPGIIAVFFSLNGEYAGVRIYSVPDFRQYFELPQPKVEVEVRQNEVILRNTGKTVAFHLHLSFPDLPDKQIIFHDNYLTLAPGETRIVKFHGNAGDTKLQIHSLNQTGNICL